MYIDLAGRRSSARLRYVRAHNLLFLLFKRWRVGERGCADKSGTWNTIGWNCIVKRGIQSGLICLSINPGRMYQDNRAENKLMNGSPGQAEAVLALWVPSAECRAWEIK
jgi:hypothetical protein